MRAIGYTRVSTAGQAEQGVSLDLQPAAIRAYCAANGLELIEIIEDANASGGTALARRKGGARLLALLKQGGIDVVVTTYIDRLFRDTLDGLTVMRKTLPKLGVSVRCINDAIDLATPAGVFAATLALARAEFERGIAVDRAKRTNAGLKAAGRVYGGVPYGCIAVTTAGARGEPVQLLQRDPATWPTRERIVALRKPVDRSGEPLPRLSLRALASALRAQRIPAPDGGERWSPQTLSRILDTHATLVQLPMAQCALPHTDAPVAQVTA